MLRRATSFAAARARAATQPLAAMRYATIAEAIARTRRSVLFVPASDRMDRFLGKALASEADSVVIDLEDSVAPKDKPAARDAVAAWLDTSPDLHGKELLVRVNGVGAADDVAAVLGRKTAPHGLMVPKVEGAACLEAFDALVTPLEAAGTAVGVVAIATETAKGALNLPAIAAGPRVVAVTWGAEDLGAEIGHTQKYVEADGRRRYHPLFEHCRVQCLLAARAAGVQALDGVYADIRDAAGCRAEAADAVAYGYDGKLALHPAQLDPIHAAFSVSPAAVAKAEKIVKAVEAGGGVGEVDGQMVDRPHLVSARRILARAAAGGAPSAVSARPVRGKYLEDLTEGLVIEHALTRTVTETDNVLATTLSLNPAALHLDHASALDSEFKRPLMNSMFTLSLLVGITVHETTHGTTVANLGFKDVAFPAPVFAGDTISARTTVASSRRSKSRPSQGVVEFKHEAFNQRGALVAACTRSALMMARPL
mmetsp:Transcript_12105/g.37270  ORF Transcript_12105/g.37270 Transcript_12105/m.37270 type:complete len:482 (-) Transcript_12105:60-1505(-)